MGNSSSTEINTDLTNRTVKNVCSTLSDRDRKLFNHAKNAIAMEESKCDDCELFIDFQDQRGVTIQSNRNPSKRIIVEYDRYNRPTYVWEKRGIVGNVKHFFIKTWRSLLNAASEAVVEALAFGALKAITH